MKKTLLSLAFVTIFFTSCQVTRTTIGNGPIGKQPDNQTYSKTKQMYLIRGIIPLGFAQVQLHPSGNYQIKTSKKFIDCLVEGLTFGVFTMQTVEVLIKPEGKK